MVLLGLKERERYRTRARRQHPANSGRDLLQKAFGIVRGLQNGGNHQKRREQRQDRRIRSPFRYRELPVLEGLPEGPTKPRKVHPVTRLKGIQELSKMKTHQALSSQVTSVQSPPG